MTQKAGGSQIYFSPADLASPHRRNHQHHLCSEGLSKHYHNLHFKYTHGTDLTQSFTSHHLSTSITPPMGNAADTDRHLQFSFQMGHTRHTNITLNWMKLNWNIVAIKTQKDLGFHSLSGKTSSLKKILIYTVQIPQAVELDNWLTIRRKSIFNVFKEEILITLKC